MYKAPTILLLTFLLLNPTKGQNGEFQDRNHSHAAIEKTYLQTDKDFYFLRDTIWHKAYLLDGLSLCPVHDIQNLHIDLIDSSGRIVLEQMLMCENGLASGRMIIPDSLASGPFLLRAYTDYQRNFGEELYFHKTIQISRVKNSFEIEAERSSDNIEEINIDVSFFPEGGFLLAETENLVAFKAIDQRGLGIEVQGVIVNDKREAVVAFRTDYKGMGRFSFKPKRNESYQVIINEYPEFSYQFEDIRSEAKKLVLSGQSRKELIVEILSNKGKRSREQSHIACYARDSLLFHNDISHRGRMKLKIETDVLLPGVNRIVLLNEALEPLSERLVFREKQAINELYIKTKKNEYSTRDQVELSIVDSLNRQEASISNLCISVVNRNALLGRGFHQHLASYLLLDSELHGYIESPADFFIDDLYYTSIYKLNLLMLTHGWCNYHETPLDTIRHPKSAGIMIAGHAEKLIGTKHLHGGNVTLGLFTANDRYFLEEKVNENGYFSFDSLVFFDTASIFVQVLNDKGKKRSDIYLDENHTVNPKVSNALLHSMKHIADLPLEHYKQRYNSEQDFREYKPTEGAIQLEEVEIVDRKKEKQVDDGHFRIYREADQVIEVESYDEHSAILPFLLRKVNGLHIAYGGELNMRGIRSLNGVNSPLFVVNGIPISSDGAMDVIGSIQMSNVDKIEVLKGGTAVIYGSRGANGVIAIYTKMGEIPEEVESEIFGVITERVKGYSNYREFYSPKYTPENRHDPKPDHRTTLYWNPEVTLDSDQPWETSFYTADDLGYYRIIVEGITHDGRIYLGTDDFMVDSHISEN